MVHISEPDWKVFRQLHQVVVERFCDKVLAEVQRVISDVSKSHHERYGDVYGLILDRNKEMAQIIDAYRRSTALFQLGLMHMRGFLAEEEISRFSAGTRRILDNYARAFNVR